MEKDRIERFGDDFNFLTNAKLPQQINNSSYFTDKEISIRMDEIRSSIERIRKNWENYDHYLNLAFKLVEEYNKNNINDSYVQGFFNKIKTRRNWFDVELEGFSTPVNYDVVNAFTSKNHYGKIFSPMNDIFRDRKKSKNIDLVDGATFLNEIINIDLYNYINKDESSSNFQGVVYRGMNLSVDVINLIKKIATLPINDRMIAIPLDMQSSSTNIEIAKSFIDYRLKKYTNDIGVLWKIHITGLDKDYIDIYNEKFSSGRLSSMCAVPIMNLSEIKTEQEVLLRGGFHYILDVYDSSSEIVNNKPIVVVETVMLNTNRDHLNTTLHLDENARKLMFKMVANKRHQFCQEFYFDRNEIKLAEQHNNEKIRYKKEIKELIR